MKTTWDVYILAIVFLVAGVFHFVKPKAFMRIMPRYLPYHRLLVLLSGFFEILAAIGLIFNQTRAISAWLVIAMLIVFTPVHIYMITNKKASLNLPFWLLYTRLFVQVLLIVWAYSYTLSS